MTNVVWGKNRADETQRVASSPYSRKGTELPADIVNMTETIDQFVNGVDLPMNTPSSAYLNLNLPRRGV